MKVDRKATALSTLAVLGTAGLLPFLNDNLSGLIYLPALALGAILTALWGFAPTSLGRKQLGPIIVMVLSALIFAGGAGWYYVSAKAEKTEPAKSKVAVKPPVEVFIECFAQTMPLKMAGNATIFRPMIFDGKIVIGWEQIPSGATYDMGKSEILQTCRITNYGTRPIFNLQLDVNIEKVVDGPVNWSDLHALNVGRIDPGADSSTEIHFYNDRKFAFVMKIASAKSDDFTVELRQSATAGPIMLRARQYRLPGEK